MAPRVARVTDLAEAPRDEALEAARWDLEPLLEGGTTESLLDEAAERAKAFAQRYRGTLAELDVAGLAEAMRELEGISEKAGRAGSYASLSFSLDTEDPERGALMQKVRERSTELQTELLFFDLEWNELPDDHVEPLLDDPALAFCAHHLRMLRRYRPHQLSEPEEQMLTETAVTGPSAFRRLFTELVSALRVELPDEDEPVPLMQALSNLQDPDRERRRQAAAGVTACAGAGPAHAGVRDQHPGRRQGDQGPPAPLRPLAGLAQPLQRGQRRVGRGADRRGAGPLRPGAALVPS